MRHPTRWRSHAGMHREQAQLAVSAATSDSCLSLAASLRLGRRRLTLRRERHLAIPAELLFARIGHWYTGLTITGATDSANVFVGMSKGKAPDGALAQVLTAVVTGLHALGADLFATWVCREANGWADALAGALTIDAAIAVTRGWHARIHASRAARTHSTKGKG